MQNYTEEDLKAAFMAGEKLASFEWCKSEVCSTDGDGCACSKNGQKVEYVSFGDWEKPKGNNIREFLDSRELRLTIINAIEGGKTSEYELDEDGEVEVENDYIDVGYATDNVINRLKETLVYTLPKYATLNNLPVRLLGDESKYKYIITGNLIGFRWVGEKLFSVVPKHKNFHNKEILFVTKEVWSKMESDLLKKLNLL